MEDGGCRGCRVVGGGWRDPGGRGAACPGVGSGVMADAGDTACLPMLSGTAALCVGGGSYTAGFQTITLNICKQIKKQNHPVQMESSVFLSLPVHAPLHLSSGVSEKVSKGRFLSLQAPPTPSPRVFWTQHLPLGPLGWTGRSGHTDQPPGSGHAQTFGKDFLFSEVLP